MADKDKTEGAEGAKKTASTVLNSYFGTVDPATLETRKDKSGNDYYFAKMKVEGPEKVLDLYVRGKLMEAFKAKVDAGETIFVSGESLAKGNGMSVSMLEPKVYEGDILKIHASGNNDYGDYAAVKLKIDGMKNEPNVMLKGDDAQAAVAAGEGGKIKFEGAWKPEQNSETKKWYSRLTSASGLRANDPAPAAEGPGM